MRRAGQVDDELAHVFDGLRLALGQQAGLVAFPGLRLAFAGLPPAARQAVLAAPHSGADDSRAERVDRHPVARDLLGQGIAETDHGKLRGTVVGEVGETDLAGDR
ncbi:Uncharacterised protein [Acinetobacter baumannii]|nr:Uncharacterised protein [Acinetobacter baumannii]